MTPLRQRMMEDLQLRTRHSGGIHPRLSPSLPSISASRPTNLARSTFGLINSFSSKRRGVSLPTYIQAVCGIRFLYTNTLQRQIDIERIPLPRYAKKLPVMLSQEEVKLLLRAPKNLAYRTMLTTMYAAGPRVSDVANLKMGDIDSGRNVLWIRGGKGRKDGKPCYLPSCWNCCVSTGAGGVPRIGRSPAGNPASQSPAHPFFGPARSPRRTLASRRPSIRTRCATPLRPICWKPA